MKPVTNQKSKKKSPALLVVAQVADKVVVLDDGLVVARAVVPLRAVVDPLAMVRDDFVGDGWVACDDLLDKPTVAPKMPNPKKNLLSTRCRTLLAGVQSAQRGRAFLPCDVDNVHAAYTARKADALENFHDSTELFAVGGQSAPLGPVTSRKLSRPVVDEDPQHVFIHAARRLSDHIEGSTYLKKQFFIPQANSAALSNRIQGSAAHRES
jgi:hypothetical protein